MSSAGKSAIDVAIIGAGHNGLTCAAYLAQAGLKVTLFERRGIAGGAAVTEEFHPGFRNSTASYTVSLLHPQVIRELNLAAHGLRVLERPLLNYVAEAPGQGLRIGPTSKDTEQRLATRSPRDAERYVPAAQLDAGVALLKDLLLETPPPTCRVFRTCGRRSAWAPLPPAAARNAACRARAVHAQRRRSARWLVRG